VPGFENCKNPNYIARKGRTARILCAEAGKCLALEKLEKDKKIGGMSRENAEKYADDTRGCVCKSDLQDYAKTF